MIHGTAKMMPRNTLKITPGEAVIQYLPALRPENFGSREELMATVRAEMAKALGYAEEG